MSFGGTQNQSRREKAGLQIGLKCIALKFLTNSLLFYLKKKKFVAFLHS